MYLDSCCILLAYVSYDQVDSRLLLVLLLIDIDMEMSIYL